MGKEKPCCPAAAARDTRKLMLSNGVQIGIIRLDEILKEVHTLGIEDESMLKAELLSRAKVSNYIPIQATEEYGNALLKEYMRFQLKIILTAPKE